MGADAATKPYDLQGQPALPVAPSGPVPAFAGAPGLMMGLGGPPPMMHKSMGNTMMPGAMMPQPGQVLVLAPGTARLNEQLHRTS